MKVLCIGGFNHCVAVNVPLRNGVPPVDLRVPVAASLSQSVLEDASPVFRYETYNLRQAFLRPSERQSYFVYVHSQCSEADAIAYINDNTINEQIYKLRSFAP